VIYDGFLFFNELELLDLRLHELEGVVDRHILVESSVTHSGKPKPMFFRENMARFERYLGKIIHVEVMDTPETKVTWDREIFQRNAILRGLSGAKPDDTLIMSDLDEIPKAETLKKVIPPAGIVALNMRSYGGYLNARSGDWSYAKVTSVKTALQITPQKLRHDQHPKVEDGGWHFSYSGGPEKVHEKMNAFSHQELPVQRWNKLDLLKKSLADGVGIFGGKMSFEKIDSSFPAYLREHPDLFPGMIWPLPQ
jgi:beta-1,4-mannosyl-glycoprotein beta-1,4-N-acetylglucosaminyltransferase